jgi:hypothetical protein
MGCFVVRSCLLKVPVANAIQVKEGRNPYKTKPFEPGEIIPGTL